MGGQYETNTGFACCRGFAAFGSLIGSIGLGLPRHRSRLRRLGAELLSHRCQAHRAASMRELQPPAGLHHPVVSSRRLTRAQSASRLAPPEQPIDAREGIARRDRLPMESPDRNPARPGPGDFGLWQPVSGCPYFPNECGRHGHPAKRGSLIDVA